MTVDLVIAGRRIRLCSRDGVIIRPDGRFTAFTVPAVLQHTGYIEAVPGVLSDVDPGFPDAVIPAVTEEIVPDLVVDVEPGTGEMPSGAVKVFDARLMEEVPGGIVNSGEPFWEIFSGAGVTCARVFLKDPERTALLMMPHGEMRWRIFTGEIQNEDQPGCRGTVQQPQYLAKGVSVQEKPGRNQQDDNGRNQHGTTEHPENLPDPLSVPGSIPDRSADSVSGKRSSADETGLILNPLPYPLDGLLLYFLFSGGGDIMIHGSGVSCHGRGWVFTGRSGRGKTTLARIFDRAGDRVIHDDRLVLRREGCRWVMHNTPVYRNDEPRSVPVDHIWLIRHGSANVSEPVTGAEAVAMIIANCIQQNWDRDAAARLAAAADDLVTAVRVSRLSFLPDGTVRDYLRLRKEEGFSIAAGTAAVLLEEGRNITVTAGGYSMWPAIRPGDEVIIGPCSSGAAAAGQIVALRRDGGFVLHRITDVIISEGRKLIVTCGDAAARADEPAGPESVAGLVISVTRRGRQLPPPRRRRPRWFNRSWALLDAVIRPRIRKTT
ncbi:MAG: hypothetical protein QUS66_12225 [Bacteroidota bacterium]|nr:hypothetical protein [Bacteroidota bacterium]